MLVQISGDYGEPKADDVFWPLQRELNHLFKQNDLEKCFETLRVFSIVFRVSGKITDFGAGGPEKIKYIKKKSEITMDLVFPESSWKGLSLIEVKGNIVGGLDDCLEEMCSKAEKLKEIKDIGTFNTYFKNVIGEFIAK